MAVTLAEVEAAALALPEVTEGTSYGNRTWNVGKAHFAWVRPMSKADIKRWDDGPLPEGDLLALVTDDLAEKEAVLAAGHRGVFTIAHFDGYAAVIVALDAVAPGVFAELLEDAWLAKAPAKLAKAHLEGR